MNGANDMRSIELCDSEHGHHDCSEQCQSCIDRCDSCALDLSYGELRLDPIIETKIPEPQKVQPAIEECAVSRLVPTTEQPSKLVTPAIQENPEL